MSPEALIGIVSREFVQTGFIQTLGWTLAHFIWQGILLALGLYTLAAYCRSAVSRYRCAVVTLALMAAAPVLTFTLLWQNAGQRLEVSTYHVTAAAAPVAMATLQDAGVPHSLLSVNWPAYCAAAWLLGVLVFALRALGGWVLVQRLYKEKGQPLTPLLAARCEALRRRLGINHKVRFFLTHTIDAPAVIGWFRPVVLLPVTALTGLSPEQLEAILVHELAHIQRLDCFVNVFQIAAETLLFYHPAVWWVSSTVRAERENCCDDIAVEVCGDVGAYARALTVVESWRAMPAFAVAANSSPLKLRIERLLGLKTMASNISAASIGAVGLICATGALLASSSLSSLQQISTPHSSAAVLPVHAPQQASSPAPAAQPAVLRAFAKPSPSHSPAADDSKADQPQAAQSQARQPQSDQPAAQTADNDNARNKSSYIEGLQNAGLKNIDIGELIALKVQGVTPDYIRELHSTGLTPNTGEIIAMKVQGITPEYIRKIRQTWPGTNIGEVIAMKVQGVNPSDAAGYEGVGVHGMNVGQLIAFRVQGITPDYVRSLQSAGLANLTTGDIIAAKVQGITPEFVQQVRARGFTNVSLHQLIGLKAAGVF